MRSFARIFTLLLCLGIIRLHSTPLSASNDYPLPLDVDDHFSEATLTADSLDLLTLKQGERFFIIQGENKRLSNHNETISLKIGGEAHMIGKHWRVCIFTLKTNGATQVAIRRETDHRSFGGKLENEIKGYTASEKGVLPLTKQQIQSLFKQADQE